jgi:glycosyltransferase involved in cell wall biosynthesis
MIYLTVNDLPGGIYTSQVIKKIPYLEKKYNERFFLIAFIPFRLFFTYKKKFPKVEFPLMVLPMLPSLSLWRWNGIFLLPFLIFSRHRTIMGRGVLATGLALLLKRIRLVNEVIHDGRGAFYAELDEYGIIKNEKLKREFYELEKKCVLACDFNYAVSYSLIDYWRNTFGYSRNNFIVVPCAVSEEYVQSFSEDEVKECRNRLGFSDDDAVVVFSAGKGEWQSFDWFYDFFRKKMKKKLNLKLLILSDSNSYINKLKEEFGSRVIQKFVQPNEVRKHLLSADYGWLVRHSSVTNKVASPVKFAEYLSCGLKVLISPELGDFSEFVRNHHAGSIISPDMDTPEFSKVSFSEKVRLQSLATQYFTFENLLKE